MSSDGRHVHPARVEALSRKVDALRDEYEKQIEKLESENHELADRVNRLERKLEAIGADDIKPNGPDKRALRVRKWLYEQANESTSGKASMDKNVAKGVLGNVSREQRYEAMRRAADGDEGARSGSSSLSPIHGIRFQKFEDPDRLTRVVIDLEEVTRKLGSKNLTTNNMNGGI